VVELKDGVAKHFGLDNTASMHFTYTPANGKGKRMVMKD
jgi:hypothetical protein